MRDMLGGAALGAAAGFAAGLMGEIATWAVLQWFPTDAGISGFALVWAIPLGIMVGAISGWQGWFRAWRRRAVAAAVPGLLAGVAQALLQLSMV